MPGKWENIIRSVYILPQNLSDRINIKGFGNRVKDNPQKHGELNNTRYEFWNASFWEIDTDSRGLSQHQEE